MWNTKKLEKKNLVAVLFLRENGRADRMEIKSEKGFFNIEGKTYHERRDCTYTMGKERYPLAIIHEWSLTPMGTKQWHDKSIQETLSILQDHCMKGIRHAERVRSGEDMYNTKINAKNAILIGIAVIVAIAFFMGYV